VSKETELVKRQFMLQPRIVEQHEAAAKRRQVSDGEEARRIFDAWYNGGLHKGQAGRVSRPGTDDHLSPVETIYQLAVTAGRHAGKRSATEHGRDEWNDEDLQVAAEVTSNVLEAARGKPKQAEQPSEANDESDDPPIEGAEL